MPLASNPTNIYSANEMVGLVRRGRIWVQINAAVTLDTPVYCIYSGSAGQFRGDNTNAVLVPTAKWVMSASSGIALLEINLP